MAVDTSDQLDNSHGTTKENVTKEDGDANVRADADFATRFGRMMTHVCEINHETINPCPGKTKFHSLTIPKISITDYVLRVQQFVSCSESCFICAAIYMDRFQIATNCWLDPFTFHRLFITALLIAAKVNDDDIQNNAIYAKIGGLSTLELNMLECELLNYLQFDVIVSVERFEHCCAAMNACSAFKSNG